MKRIIAMLLAIMMLLSLVACGNSEKPAETNPAETKPAASNQEGEAEGYTGPTGEITFVAWGSDNEIACDLKACEAFMASHPGTVVNFEALNEDYGTAVETRVIGGQAPDVIYGHPATLLKWIQEGMLQPITDVYENNEELWNEDIFFTNLYESYYYDGEYWVFILKKMRQMWFK